MVMSARDLARLLELNKKKAELEFQRDVLGMHALEELGPIISNLESLNAKAKDAGVEIVLPDQKRFEELGKDLAGFSPQDIREGLKIRDGQAYQALKDRGMIVKKHQENRFEIAKMCILMSTMENDQRKALSVAVKEGALAGNVSIGSLDEMDRKKLARFLRRCGISCAVSKEELAPALEDEEKEVRIEVSNRNVWISESSKALLEENLRRINTVNARIQLKNAERQIKVFDTEEENLFASLQREYLDLLKEQDELLKEYNGEEKRPLKNQL